jgi:hypothetical protein
LFTYFRESNRLFPYAMTTLHNSRHLYHFTTFLEALGLISHEGYLETRSWFCRSAELQRITLEVVLQGNGAQINVKSPDYRTHITSLLRVT